MRCKAITKAGKPCESPSHLINPHTLLCRVHDPARAEEIREIGRKGGLKAAERFRMKGIQPHELGELRTAEDVRRWLERVAQGIACGTMSARAGAACVRALDIALKALDAGQMADRIKFLVGQLAEMRKLCVS